MKRIFFLFIAAFFISNCYASDLQFKLVNIVTSTPNTQVFNNDLILHIYPGQSQIITEKTLMDKIKPIGQIIIIPLYCQYNNSTTPGSFYIIWKIGQGLINTGGECIVRNINVRGYWYGGIPTGDVAVK